MGPRRNADILNILDLFVATGLRPGELLAVRYQEIDLGTGTLAVIGTIKRTKAEKLHRQAFPKSEHGARVLHLPSFALSMLRERKIAAADKEGLVFTIVTETSLSRRTSGGYGAMRGARSGKPLQPRSFYKTVTTLIERIQ